MKVSINIKVRNSDWYHSDGSMGNYLEEWQLINEDKVPKHLYAVDFEYYEDVNSYKSIANTNFQLDIYSVNELNEQTKETIVLEDVTIAEFELNDSVSKVVVSNDLIYQFIAAHKRGIRHYWYFYLKEDVEFIQLLNNVWITKKQFEDIKSAYHKFAVPIDEKLKIRSFTGVIEG